MLDCPSQMIAVLLRCTGGTVGKNRMTSTFVMTALCPAEVLVNLVKESLLTMVRVMFAHAACNPNTVQATSANASGTALYMVGLLGVPESNKSLHAQDSYAESTARRTARSAHERTASVSRSSSHRIAVPTADSLDASVPLSLLGGKHGKGSEG